MKGILGFVISELSLKFSQNKWFVCGVMSGGFMLQFYLFPQKLDVGQSFELRSGKTEESFVLSSAAVMGHGDAAVATLVLLLMG
ncbi:hypothetical protein CsSME_00047550 [Camellia sinensis var. sinensis]